jgi:Amt family ammonium transporter
MMTGVLNDPALGGFSWYDYVANAAAPYSMSTQVISQLWGVCVTLLWSGVVALIAFKLVDWTIGLRVTEDVEREGLDTTLHGERAYD